MNLANEPQGLAFARREAISLAARQRRQRIRIAATRAAIALAALAAIAVTANAIAGGWR